MIALSSMAGKDFSVWTDWKCLVLLLLLRIKQCDPSGCSALVLLNVAFRDEITQSLQSDYSFKTDPVFNLEMDTHAL